jgi:hypothetical protein
MNKRIFRIPVGHLSKRKALKKIDSTMKEYNEDKSKETDPDRDKNDIKISEDCTFVDWNKFSMDELADYLEYKWKFMSSGEAFAICKMIDFYRSHKNV